VTGDRDLLSLRTYREIAIVNPGQFLLALELYSTEAGALAERFKPEVLAEIVQAIPLDPETTSRVREALDV